MHVKDMNAQTVAFLKGAVTQGAGKLPVSVINAARVFEVAIPVVFVGENFAATVARVA